MAAGIQEKCKRILKARATQALMTLNIERKDILSYPIK